jgi:hypothetical protein
MTDWMSDAVLQRFRGQEAWELRDQRCQGQARLPVRDGGQRGKRRGSLGGECRYMSGSHVEWIEDKPATVLFPTPPLPLATAMTFFTLGIPRLGGRPRRGIVGGSPRFGRP